MFELKILLANVAAPAAVLVVAMLIDLFLLGSRSSPAADRTDESVSAKHFASSTGSALVGSLGASLAIWIAFGMRNDFVWWSEDHWQRIPLAAAIVALGIFLSTLFPSRYRLLAIAVFGILALGYSANLVTPQGESWAEVVEPRILWLGLLVAGPILSALLLCKLQAPIQGWTLFSWVAASVAAAFLAAQSFMRVTEPMLAYATLFGITGIYCAVRQRIEFAICVALPTTFAMAASAAHGQFNSYLGLSNGITFLSMSQTALTTVVAFALIGLFDAGKPAGHAAPVMDEEQQAHAAPKHRGWKTLLIVFGISFLFAASTILWTGSEAGFSIDSTEEEW
ncbi:MAG: hypothetical protein AAGG44_06035 [Planctomycetota bacterium]